MEKSISLIRWGVKNIGKGLTGSAIGTEMESVTGFILARSYRRRCNISWTTVTRYPVISGGRGLCP